MFARAKKDSVATELSVPVSIPLHLPQVSFFIVCLTYDDEFLVSRCSLT